VVKSYRGQRKCQATEDGRKCGQPLNLHIDRVWIFIDEEGNQSVKAAHTDSVSWEINGHPFTQTPLTCGYCSKPINVGESYKWIKTRPHRAARGVRRIRHTYHPNWKPSETTSSVHLSIIYGAQETAEADLEALSDPDNADDAEDFLEAVKEAATAFAEGIREASETYRESAEAIEEGFGHPTYQSEELADNSEAVEQWADDVESINFEGFEGEDAVCEWCGNPEDDSYHGNPEDDDVDEDSEEFEEYHDYVEGASGIEDWAEEQRGMLYDALQEQPF
jgi:hypothetical protein